MWVETLKTGKVRYVERYQNFMTGKQKKISISYDKDTPKNKKEAYAILSERINKASSSLQETEITLKELYRLYGEYQAKTVAHSTYRRNAYTANVILDILGENTIVNKMTAGYIHNRLLDTGKAAATLNEYIIRIKSAINWAYSAEIIPSNACAAKLSLFKDKPHKEKIKDKFLEADELKTLIEAIKIPDWKLTTKFLALSGLRFGEYAALEKTDIDFKNHYIHITKSFDSIDKIVGNTKNSDSIRNVYMQPELEDTAKEIISLMTQRKKLNGIRCKLFIFDTSGNHIEYYSYNKYLKAVSKRTLDHEITPHALRHTHASLLFEKGFSIDEVARRLGHGNSKITRDIYVHITEKLKEKDNEKLSGISIL